MAYESRTSYSPSAFGSTSSQMSTSTSVYYSAVLHPAVGVVLKTALTKDNISFASVFRVPSHRVA